MKISIIFAAIILSLAALFTSKQDEKIITLTAELEDLKATALEKDLPSDLKLAFSFQRMRSADSRAARQKVITDFSTELVALARKMKTAAKNGGTDYADLQKEAQIYTDKITGMSPNDLKSLLIALSTDPSIENDIRHGFITLTIELISSDNPEAALALIAEAYENPSIGNNSIRRFTHSALNQLAAKDPQTAATWIAGNEKKLGDEVDYLKREVIAAAARKSFTSAIALTATLNPDYPNQALAHSVKAGDQDDFIKFLDDNKVTGLDRKTAFLTLAHSPFIKEDFKVVTAWLENPKLSASDKDLFIQSLQFSSVRKKPEEWFTWISTQEVKTRTLTRATHQILKGWARENFVAAGEWIQTQEPGPAKNAAIQTYAQTLAPHEPAAAADWAVTLPEGPKRQHILQTIHNSLKEKDPTAATALAEKHGLPSENR